MRLFCKGVYLEKVWAATSFICLITVQHGGGSLRSVCAGLRIHPRPVSANVHAAMLHQLIIYNHVKGLYCTNSTSMLTEWLCGMDPAEPDRSVISLNHSQNEITTQRETEGLLTHL